MFNDASGARLSAIQWGSRILLALVVLFGVALALTLRSHVSVPGLERLMPGLDANQVRPLVRTGPSNRPAERTAGRTGPSTPQPRPATSPKASRVPTTAAVQTAETRPVVGPSTVPPAIEPTSAPSLRATAGPTASASPTGSASPTDSVSPTTRTVGRGTVKPRNPKAATPSPAKQQAPGQNRTPKPKPDRDLG